jgi:hypothetical protein
MYAGLGAKLVRLDPDNTLLPASYQETETKFPPPPPPIDDKPDRKRHRQDTKAERADDIALIWAALQTLQQSKVTDSRRITVLETEN